MQNLKIIVVIAIATFVANHEEIKVLLPEFGCKEFNLFTDAEIAFAKGECYQNPWGAPDLELIDLSKKETSELVDCFRQSKIDGHPDLNMAEICSIRIVNADGQSQRLSVFWLNAKQPTICFSLNGIRCICLVEARTSDGEPRDHALIIDGKIRSHAQKQQNGRPSVTVK